MPSMKRQGRGPKKQPPHLLAILKSAASHPHQELSLTLGPVIKIWNDNREKKTVPSRAEIADALTLTKGSRVRIDETTGTLTLMPGTQIDLGAVAKGATPWKKRPRSSRRKAASKPPSSTPAATSRSLEKSLITNLGASASRTRRIRKGPGNPFGSSRYSHCNKRRLSALLRSKRRPLPSHPQSADGLAQPQCPFRYSRYSIGLFGQIFIPPCSLS